MRAKEGSAGEEQFKRLLWDKYLNFYAPGKKLLFDMIKAYEGHQNWLILQKEANKCSYQI